MNNIMLSQKIDAPARAGNLRAQKHFRPGMAAKRFLGMAVLAGTIIILSSRMAVAQEKPLQMQGAGQDSANTVLVQKQEKVGLYPNYSFQGVFGNPALFTDLGDWGYMSYNMGKEPSAAFQVSNSFRGVQLNGSYTSNDAWMANASMKLSEKFNAGATFTPGNKKGIVGMTYRPVHTAGNMTQAGAQFDLGSKTAKVALETRFPVSGSVELTVSGNVSFDNKLVKNQGFGFQWAIDKFRTALGLSGKGKTVINIAEQVNLGNSLLPDAGVQIENGKAVSGWIGILKLF